MIEFAVVLLIKRLMHFQKKKQSKVILHRNKKEHVNKRSSTEGQNEFLLKEKKLHADENEAHQDIESNYSNEEHEKLLYSTTDVIDFVSLFIFLICYIMFNCIYMRFYLS